MNILGSHNSWSYLPVRKWWMWPIRFMARCQSVDIKRQYELGVRCFDLRVRFKKGKLVIAHGIVEYNYDKREWMNQMELIDGHGDCYIRIIHEVRTKRQADSSSKKSFKDFCEFTAWVYPNIKFWNGRNLYNFEKDYDFGEDPSNDGKYASVCLPKIIDDWWPWLYARLHNRKIRKEGTEKDILLIDFVNIV